MPGPHITPSMSEGDRPALSEQFIPEFMKRNGSSREHWGLPLILGLEERKKKPFRNSYLVKYVCSAVARWVPVVFNDASLPLFACGSYLTMYGRKRQLKTRISLFQGGGGRDGDSRYESEMYTVRRSHAR